MKNTKKKRRLGLAVSVSAIVMIIFIVGHTGLRKSEGRIEKEILQHVQRGDDFSEVKNYIISNNYRIIIENRTSGRSDRRVDPPVEIGQMHFLVKIGEYGVFFKTNVFAVFAFDKEGKLVDVWVIKELDSL